MTEKLISLSVEVTVIVGGNGKVGPKYLKECEGNIELVSEDQWIRH